MNKTTIALVAIIGLIAGMLFVGQKDNSLSGAVTNCDVTTTTAVTVGPTSSTILSATSGRTYARIQQLNTATTTLTVTLGDTATVGNGLELTVSTSSSPVPYLELGMETSLPYTGIVTGIMSSGTTTVLVTECR